MSTRAEFIDSELTQFLPRNLELFQVNIGQAEVMGQPLQPLANVTLCPVVRICEKEIDSFLISQHSIRKFYSGMYVHTPVWP